MAAGREIAGVAVAEREQVLLQLHHVWAITHARAEIAIRRNRAEHQHHRFVINGIESLAAIDHAAQPTRRRDGAPQMVGHHCRGPIPERPFDVEPVGEVTLGHGDQRRGDRRPRRRCR